MIVFPGVYQMAVFNAHLRVKVATINNGKMRLISMLQYHPVWNLFSGLHNVLPVCHRSYAFPFTSLQSDSVSVILDILYQLQYMANFFQKKNLSTNAVKYRNQ